MQRTRRGEAPHHMAAALTAMKVRLDRLKIF